MQATVLIYWMFALQATLLVSSLHGANGQMNDDRRKELEAITIEGSAPGLLFDPYSWMTVSIRGKRNEEATEETIPTRHAKHRKRRRCRNRPTCSTRGVSTGRLSSSQSNATEHRSKNEDYDVTEAIDAKDVTMLTNKTISVVENTTESENIDSYDERVLSEEIEFEKTEDTSSVNGKAQSKRNEIEATVDYKEDVIYPSPFYIEDQVEMPESLGALLSKLFQSLRNATAAEGHDIFKELNFVNTTNEDPCQRWLNSKDKLEKVFLGGLVSLPACPCEYPSNIFYEDKIWDEMQKKHFRWRDVSGNSQRLDIYKPGATYCIRSLLTQGSGSAAAQHCCYDNDRKLLTRGSGAGTPNFVSPDISPVLHERIDILPWRLCKGDFSRYNGVRPPNNDNNCKANPDDEEYQRQIDNTKHY